MSQDVATPRAINRSLLLFLEGAQKRWFLLALIVITVPLSAALMRSSFPVKLKSKTQILIQQEVKINPFIKNLLVQWSVKTQLAVFESLARSRGVQQAVLNQLGAIKDTDTAATIDEKLNDFASELEIYTERAGVVHLSITGSDGERIYQALKVLVAELVNRMITPQREGLDDWVQFLGVQTQRVASELVAVESELEAFKREHARELPAVHQMNLANHLRLMNSAVETEADLVAAKRRVTVSRDRLSRLLDSTPTSPEIQELDKQIKEADERLENLRQVYTQRHGTIRKAQKKLKRFQDERNLLLETLRLQHTGDLAVLGETEFAIESSVGSTATPQVVVKGKDALTGEILTYRAAVNKAESLEYKLSLLQERLELSLKSVKAFASHEQKLNQLVRNHEAKQKTHMTLSSQLENAKLARDLTFDATGRQLYAIEEPLRPLGRLLGLKIILVLGLIGGLALAVGINLLFEVLDRSVRLPDEVVAETGLPVIGTLTAHLDKHR